MSGSGAGAGCCCGIIAGCVLALSLIVAAIVGLYLWLNPDVREETAESATRVWIRVRGDVAKLPKPSAEREKPVAPEEPAVTESAPDAPSPGMPGIR